MTDPRPCPACGAPLSIEDTHWSLFPEPMGGYVCPVAPAEGLDAVPCYDQHTAGIDEHWHAIPTRSGFSCIVCGERLLEERQFCAKCEPSWRHPAAPAEGLREALNVLLIEIDVHGLCECVPPYPRGDRHAPECDVDDGLRAAIDRLRSALKEPTDD